MVENKVRGAVAVTRNGLGDWWSFNDYSSADTHPLIQYGDVICCGPDDIIVKWVRSEIPLLLDQLMDPVDRARMLVEFKNADWSNWKRTMNRFKDELWVRMQQKAVAPPTELKTLFDLIVRDRKLSLKEHKTMAKETSKATAAEPTSAEATSAAAEPGTTKRAPPVREPKYKNEAIITMLADKDGNAFSAENNPKRVGSNAHRRFALYVNGMTVEQAVAAGLTRADIDFDVQKKYISVA